jgi:hypothetical protein
MAENNSLTSTFT